MTRICAAARADIRWVTAGGARLSLTEELAAATQILTSAGVNVSAEIPGGPLPAVADQVLAPVLREAVTNILRHATPTACLIEVRADARTLRLHVRNDGVRPQADEECPATSGASSGLANMTARVQAAGGRLSFCQAQAGFELTARIPLQPLCQTAAS